MGNSKTKNSMNQEILNLESVFSDIYGDNPDVIEKQLKRYSELTEGYIEKFGSGGLQYFSTPGRTEIGGNHTDHNYGRVLAGSIDMDSVGYDNAFVVDLDNLICNCDFHKWKYFSHGGNLQT